jgi:hypothetical protein|nr:MAG TPA: hypothetical protein [Caudoviricetes sp.]
MSSDSAVFYLFYICDAVFAYYIMKLITKNSVAHWVGTVALFLMFAILSEIGIIALATKDLPKWMGMASVAAAYGIVDNAIGPKLAEIDLKLNIVTNILVVVGLGASIAGFAALFFV